LNDRKAEGKRGEGGGEKGRKESGGEGRGKSRRISLNENSSEKKKNMKLDQKGLGSREE